MSKIKQQKKKSILIRIFTVIFFFTISTILFFLAFWGVLINKPNHLYAHLHLAITLVILIAVGSMVASFIIRKILRPLSVISKAVENVGKGNLDQSISVKSNDELGALANAFNQMTADLRKMNLAREQLLLDVSHELRTPITRAKLALEMMSDSSEKESLAGDLKEMEMMVTEILESERIKNGSVKLNIAPVKVGELLQKLMDNYKRQNKYVTVFPVSPDLVINADEYWILIVLRNLIDNSVKYATTPEKPVEVSVIRDNSGITIQIEDYGKGIPEEKLPFVFEPFYRADASRSRQTGGYGLGLHICKRIMDMHGAEIKLSNKNSGTGIIAVLHFENYPESHPIF